MNRVGIFLETHRKFHGMPKEQFVSLTVGSPSTWTRRLNHPETITFIEAKRIFKVLKLSREEKNEFYQLMEDLV